MGWIRPLWRLLELLRAGTHRDTCINLSKMSVTVLVQPCPGVLPCSLQAPLKLDFKILLSETLHMSHRSPILLKNGSIIRVDLTPSPQAGSFIGYRRVLVCAVREVPLFFLLIFSLRHNNAICNLCFRSRFLGRKMYVIRKLVFVQPDCV